MNMTTTIAALAFGIVLAGQGAIELATDLIRTPDVRMTVKSLKYEDGEFVQWLEVEGGPIQADWAAKITRIGDDGNRRFVCAGGGRAPYDGSPSPRMDPSFWTGGNCPEIRPGDHAHASWEYRDAEGIIHRLSAEIVIGE